MLKQVQHDEEDTFLDFLGFKLRAVLKK